MDKTEIYVKMSDCPEIQGLANWEKWETGYWWNGFRVVVFLVDDMVLKEYPKLWFLNPEKCANKAVWLPTQNQIQKMFAPEDFIRLNHKFQFFWEREANDGGRTSTITLPECYLWHSGFNSAEQLWLAFYMYEKHEKVWDEEKWVGKR